MIRITRKVTGPPLNFRELAHLSSLLFTLAFLVACSHQQADDLAVAKLPRSQMLATAFLPLNADKPGTPVDVQSYLVPGKYTIVYYFSPDYSCVDLGPGLAQLSQLRHDIAVRTVNINRPGAQGVDWDSPIIQNERIGKLPYIRIYDPMQKLRAHGRPAYEQVVQWIRTQHN